MRASVASSGRLAAPEQVGGGGRHQVGLRAGLGAHLGVDPGAQVDGQRHAEGDDGQQQHVAEGEDQTGAQAYGCLPVRSPRRNPTPRTVWM